MTVRAPNGRRRDDGSVLPLVLVLMVVAGLIVIPVLGYAVAVFRSNRVVSDRTADVEAAKGGIRMALGDPRDVFITCDNGGDLTPSDPDINNVAVSVSCSEINEIGPLQALGFATPNGAAAMQFGARVAPEFSGVLAQSASVPPSYPVAPVGPDWWLGQESSQATSGKIWMPDLPALPTADRLSTPFNAFGCKIFFPGRYTAAVDLKGNDKYYFASGVYYFEKPVTVAENADVVVGYGLEEHSNPDCSDDIQVAANVVEDPGTFDINGGGATWVFGKEGRLIVDDSATTTSLRLRFNQRYADADRGARVSIMTVNGNEAAVAEHLVPNVSKVPRSKVVTVVNVPVPGTIGPPASFDSGTRRYAPSTATASATVPKGLTDKARVPQAPGGFTALPYQYLDVPTATQRGAILLTWNEVTGQAAGGAFIDGYNVTVNGSPVALTSCQAADLVVTALPGGNTVSCLVKNLALGTLYTVGVAARNHVGVGAAAAGSARPRTTSPVSPVITAPGVPSNVAAVGSDVDNVAQVSWTAPANGGAPISRYVATAHRIYLQPQPNLPPVADNMTVYMSKPGTLVTGVPAFDPNGDALALTVNTSGFPASVGTVAVAGRDITITTLAGAASTRTFTYTVTDPSGLAVTRNITVVISTGIPTNRAPIARQLDVAANVGVPITSRIPVYDPNGHGFTSFTPNTAGFAAPLWNFTVTGLDVTITTTAPNGTYTIPYTVGDSTGQTATSNIVVTVARGDETLASCQVIATPGVPLANACEIPLPDLVPGDATTGNIGYRFDVTAVNAIGSSLPASNLPPFPLGFNAGGVALPTPAPRTFEPWKPDAIIDIRASNSDPTDVEVAIAGYVAVPMGRVAIANPLGENIKVNGGVMAGTFDVVDSRAVPGLAESLPIGFKNDIVLQRIVRIVAVARNITATAMVQVNEDGATIRVNSWVIQ